MIMKKELICDVDKLYRDIIMSKKRYRNCYLQLPEVKEIYDAGMLEVYTHEEDYFLVESRNDIRYLYFFCNKWDWLNNIDELKCQNEKIVVNIVGKRSYEMPRYIEEHCALYQKYRRMRYTGNAQNVTDTEFDFCTTADIDAILELLEQFDPYSDFVPSRDELLGFIERKNILCIRVNNVVVGLLAFENKSKTSYVRFVIVNKEYRGRSLGKKLMMKWLHMHNEAVSRVLWCNVHYKEADTLYNELGFVEDGTYSYIYLL